VYFLSYIVNKLCETFDHGPILQVHFHSVFQPAATLINVPSPDTIHYVYNFDKSTKDVFETHLANDVTK